MSTSNTYLAVFRGSKSSPRRAAWDALSEGDRHDQGDRQVNYISALNEFSELFEHLFFLH